MKVCLAPTAVLSLPSFGGHFWVYANWALGLEANGCEVVWLERPPPELSSEEASRLVRSLRLRLDSAGVRAAVALDAEEAAATADLLLNFHYAMEPAAVALFPRTALVDIDPGLLQHWIAEKQLRVGPHDVYFTIGETVGTPAARFPDCGLAWQYTPPAVHLPAWPSSPAPAGAPYTSVTSWWGWYELHTGQTWNNEKRTSFLELVDLPSRTRVALELAVTLWGKSDDTDLRRLDAKGWRVRDASQVAGSPEQYRDYLRRSRAEFSCAKPSCVRLENAWVSDRSLCYLAMGKPVVVQYTGPSRILPDAEGMLRFHDLDTAASAIEAVEADYTRHARAARALAGEYFDARVVTRRVLERALP